MITSAWSKLVNNNLNYSIFESDDDFTGYTQINKYIYYILNIFQMNKNGIWTYFLWHWQLPWRAVGPNRLKSKNISLIFFI